MANNKLFRKSTYERINSPEQLDQYLKTSNPGLWLMLTGIIVVLCGALVWSFFGRLDTKLICGAKCENQELEIYIQEGHIKDVEKGMSVIVENHTYTIDTISMDPVKVGQDLSEYIKETGKLKNDEWVYPAHAKVDLDDGSYKAEIIIDSVAPKTFIIN